MFDFAGTHPHQLKSAIRSAAIIEQNGGFVDTPINPALLAHQANLQVKSVKKFDDPAQWLWSTRLLELATDQRTAEFVASNFPSDFEIFDVGCGGGADAIALAAAHRVTAIDRDPFTLRMTAANHALQLKRDSKADTAFNCRLENAEDLVVSGEQFLNIDPDRRTDRGRSIQLQWHSPGPETLQRLVSSSGGGSIKLAPGCQDRLEPIEERIGRQWITQNRSVVQQRWWWAIPDFPAGSKTVSIYRPDQGWISQCFDASQSGIDLLDLVADTEDSKIADLQNWIGQYLGDGDPSLRAADCQLALAEQLQCELVGNRFGYFFSGEPLTTPLIHWFEILAVEAVDAKKLKKLLKQFDLDRVTIKTRNLRYRPAFLDNFARGSGDRCGTLLVTEVGKRVVAFLVSERLSN